MSLIRKRAIAVPTHSHLGNIWNTESPLVEKMFSIALTQLFQTLGQVQEATSCHEPNPFEFALIIALIAGVGVCSVAGGFAIIGIAGSVVKLIVAGSGLTSAAPSMPNAAVSSKAKT